MLFKNARTKNRPYKSKWELTYTGGNQSVHLEYKSYYNPLYEKYQEACAEWKDRARELIPAPCRMSFGSSELLLEELLVNEQAACSESGDSADAGDDFENGLNFCAALFHVYILLIFGASPGYRCTALFHFYKPETMN